MPYGISQSQTDCAMWATVKETPSGAYETIGCHTNKQDAIDHMVAASINTNTEVLGQVDKRAQVITQEVIDLSNMTDELNADQRAVDMPMMDMPMQAEPVEPMEAEVEEPVESLVDEMRSLLADTVSLYFQAHGAHWNVRGSDFAQYHELFQEIYEDIYSAIDPTAENVRKLDGEAPFQLDELVALRDYPQENAADEPLSLASALLVANDRFIEELRETFDCATNYNEQGIANFLADRIDKHMKWSWQLRASTGAEVRKANAGWASRSVDGKRTVAYSNLELRTKGDTNTLVGYAAIFDSPSEPLPWTEYVRRGAFQKTLKDGADVRLLIDHEGLPLARTKSGTLMLEEDEMGLRIEAPLDESNPDAARLLSALRRGDVSQMSFAFRTVKDAWTENRNVRELKEVQLFDVSVVTYPAYEETVAELRSRNNTESDTVKPVAPIALRKRQIQLRKMQAEH